MSEPTEVELPDYVDEQGRLHIMAACGHTVSGGVKLGQKITLCPNCRFIAMFKDVWIVYPERMDMMPNAVRL